MIRSKALVVALSAAAVSVLTLVLVLFSGPAPAISHPGYAWQPGCHCGAPTTTTVKKPATTTTAKPTTTTRKPTPTTVANTTTTAPNTTTSTTVVATTTSTETTTTTLAPPLLALDIDPTYLYGSPDDQKTMDAALAMVAGLALTDGGQPPAGSGPADLSPTDGSPAATEEAAAAGGAQAEDPAAVDSQAAAEAMSPPYYYVSPVAIIFLLIYATSFILYRTKSIRVATHRKIWNLLLLATFLITGALGVILALGISRNPPWLLPSSLLFWHVEAGVVMSFISFFHMGWHLRYYLGMLMGRGSAGRKSAGERQRIAEPEVRGWAAQGQFVPAPVEEPRRRSAARG